jgi:acetyl esterase/lipase
VLSLVVREPAATLRYGDAPQQFAELWLPREGRPAPVVVFVHGGCWLNQYGVEHSRPLATALAGSGYAVFSVEYRRVGDPGGGWPGSYEDVRDAVRKLAERKPAGLDLNRVVLAGHSAGGHLSLLLAGEMAASPVDGLHLRGVLALAPVTDIADYARGDGSCNRAAVEFMGGRPESLAARYRTANPVHHKIHPGTVVLLGSDDTIIPYSLPTLGPHTLVAEPAGHFDWIHPGTPAWRRLERELELLIR